MNKEHLTTAKIADKIKKYQKTNMLCSTNFLDPAEIVDAKYLVSKLPNYFFGGYEEAERKILLIGIEIADVEMTDVETADTNIVAELPNENAVNIAKQFLTIITIESEKNLSHREVLGSILGLGINRDVIGDILISETRADVFVMKDISKYILQNLERIGREKVKVYENSYDNLLIPVSVAKEIKTTVASLRADAIISAGIGVSREISSKLIQNQKVKLNHKLLENPSKQIKVEDKMSIRGYGRLELTEVLGETRKDRIRVVLKRL